VTVDFAFDPKVINQAKKFLEDETEQFLKKKQLNSTTMTYVSVHARRTGIGSIRAGFAY